MSVRDLKLVGIVLLVILVLIGLLALVLPGSNLHTWPVKGEKCHLVSVKPLLWRCHPK